MKWIFIIYTLLAIFDGRAASAQVLFVSEGQIDCISARGKPLLSINEWYDGSLHLFLHDEILTAHPEYRHINGFHDVRVVKGDSPILRYFTSREQRGLSYRIFIVAPRIRFPFPVAFESELLIRQVSGEYPDAVLRLSCSEHWRPWHEPRK